MTPSFTFDFTIRSVDIINVLLVMWTMGILYFRTKAKIDKVEKAAETINGFRALIDTQIKNMKEGFSDNLSVLNNTLASLQRTVSEMDGKYVRKDVHDAYWMLIQEKLKPLDGILKMMKIEYTPQRRAKK